MGLPRVHSHTVEAVMKRAEDRHDEEGYVQNMFLRMHKENAPLIHGVLSVIFGMTGGLEDEDSTQKSIASYASLALALMYDCLTTQIEADELTALYGEKEDE